MRRVLRIIKWIAISLLALILLILVVFQLPFARTWLGNRIEAQFSRDLNTTVTIGQAGVGFTGKIVIEELYLEDHYGDTLLAAELAKGDINLFRLFNRDIFIHEVRLENAKANVRRPQDSLAFNYQFVVDYFAPPDTAPSKKPWTFDLADVHTERITLTYEDDRIGQSIFADLGEAEVEFKTLGLEESHLQINDLFLKDGILQIAELQDTDILVDTEEVEAGETAAQPARFTADRLTLENVAFKYDNLSEPPAPTGIDFNHLDITDLHAQLENAVFSGGDMAATVEYLRVKEQSGFVLENLQAEVSITDRAIELEQLLLETPHTKIEDYFAMLFTSYEAFGTFVSDVTLLANFEETVVAVQDLAYFIPDFEGWATLRQENINQLRLDGRFEGTVDNFTAENLNINLNDRNNLAGNITVRNVQNPQEMLITANLRQLNIQTQTIRPFLPEAAIPPELWRFGSVSANGNFTISSEDITASGLRLLVDENVFEGNAVIEGFNDMASATMQFDVDRLVAYNDVIDLLQDFGLQLPEEIANTQRAFAEGKITISPNSIIAENFTANLDNEHTFRGSATITNYDPIQNLKMDANIRVLETNSELLASFFEPGQLPENFHDLGDISYTGRIYGTYYNLHADGEITSGVGVIEPDIVLNLADQSYEGTITTENFDLSFLNTGSEGLGRVSLTATVQGQGFDIEQMQTQGTINIASLEYNDYTYRNINLEGSIEDRVITGDLIIDDENVDLDFSGIISLNEDRPVYNFTASVNRLNLQRINLTDEPYQVRGNFDLNFTGNNIDHIQGEGTVTDFVLNGAGAPLREDSIYLASTIENDTQRLVVRSGIMDADVAGQFGITQLPTAFMAVIDHYTGAFDQTYTFTEPQQFSFDLVLKQVGVLSDLFVPGLESISRGYVKGSLNTATNDLLVDANLDRVEYNDITIYNPIIEANSADGQLNYLVTANSAVFLDSMVFPNLSVSGALANQQVTFDLASATDTAAEDLNIAGALDFSGTYTVLTLDPQDIIINGEQWEVQGQNQIAFGDNYINARNVVLTYNQQQIQISSPEPNDLNIQFSNVNIYDLTQIVNYRDFVFRGRINGSLGISNAFGPMGLDMDVTASNLSINEDTIGDVVFNAVQEMTSNRTAVNISLIRGTELAEVTGYLIGTETTTNLDLTANLNAFPIVTIEPFLADFLTDMSGTASGTVDLSGTLAKPGVTGSVALRNTEFTPVLTQTHYRMEDATIALNTTSITFDDLSLYDPSDNELLVNGTIAHDYYRDFVLDISATTERFQFLNTTSADNEFFYGTIYAAGDISVTGKIFDPLISADIVSEDGSEIFIPVVSASQSLNYPFVTFLPLEEEVQEGGVASNTGFNVQFNLEVTPDAQVHVIMNELTGEQLNSRGNGSLFVTLDETGDMGIYGSYTVTEGNYLFILPALEVVRRNILLEPGSQLTWYGDPQAGRISATAVYEVQTSTYPLVEHLVRSGNMTDAQATVYQKQVPVEAIINIQGELYAPELTFDLQLDDDRAAFESEVAQRIEQVKQDPNELNKQVFGLVALGTFLPQDISNIGEAGMGPSNLIVNSLGDFATDQLSQIFSNRLGGIEVNFELAEYQTTSYSNGEAYGLQENRRLDVALSKRFLDDRLQVTVGSNYDLGNAPVNRVDQNGMLGDILITYDISQKGNLRLKAFQRQEYDIFDETVESEVGAGVSYSIEFDNLFGTREEEIAPQEEPVQPVEPPVEEQENTNPDTVGYQEEQEK